MKKRIITGLLSVLLVVAIVFMFAHLRTIGKTELSIRIHINEQLVQESTFGESPTFAIWIENINTGENKAIYVSRRAAVGDWEGKADVPVALPKWFEIQRSNESEVGNIDAWSGATPQPGYFTTSTIIPPDSKWICWIEVNLSGDFNETYLEYDTESMEADEYLSGQPALIYKAEFMATKGQQIIPALHGMCITNTLDGSIIQPIEGITTAKDIFDEIILTIQTPKPKIIANY